MILWNILGTILKIIGILLLCILLLLIFILLLVLLVPIRYRAEISRTGGDISVRAQASYLFRLIRLPVCFENGKLRIRLSVFGITLFSNGDGARERRRKKKKAQNASKAAREDCPEKNTPETVRGADEEMRDSNMDETGLPAQAGMQNEAGEAPGSADAAESGEEGRKLPQESGTEPDAEENGAQNAADAAKMPEDTQEGGKPRGIFKIIDKIVKLCRRLADKVRALFEKIAAFAEAAGSALKNLKDKLQAGKAKVSDIKEKARLILAFLRDEDNKNGIKYAGKSILRLLKHVFPYKIEGDIVFATGSPYSLGQVLAVLGILYPFYGRGLNISADFAADAFRLEGNVRFKGRIRLISIAWILWKLWREGRLKQLLQNGNELKQKLAAQA